MTYVINFVPVAKEHCGDTKGAPRRAATFSDKGHLQEGAVGCRQSEKVELWVELCLPKRHAQVLTPSSVNVTLFGNGLFEDVVS